MEQDKDYDQQIEDRLISMMREKPVKLIAYFLVILGRQMNASNADTMDLSQQFDIGKQRYKISTKSTLKKVKPTPPTH